MKLPLSWISLYSDITSVIAKKSSKEIAHIFSTHTAEVEGIETCFADKVVIGKVITCEKHPESKKLSIVRVNVGKSEVTILTGAPNIVDAHYVAVALVGAVLHGDFTIGERMMAGMMSSGMICGMDEVGLTTDPQTGIMILEAYWSETLLESMIGESFYNLTLSFPGIQGKEFSYRLHDAIFEIDNKSLTNRPDLFSVRGNAREFHALFETPFADTTFSLDTENLPSLEARVETPLCTSYHLLACDTITVGRSPLSLSLMMERAGLLPKLDIVDITNAVMVEWGQPMHAFDADTIEGNITVRMAKNGEKILALNGTEYELRDTDMVIADDAKILAIAGIIGGMSSAISETSTRVIFESACFDATAVRLTAQRLGIRTDASTRFEKSLDPHLSREALPRVLDYLSFLGKKTEIRGYFGHGGDPYTISPIEISYEFLDWKIGREIDRPMIHSILTRLGFQFETSDSGLMISVPSWRATKDINIREDIAEEVARISGYDNIVEKPLTGTITIAKRNILREIERRAQRHFSLLGWNEVYNYSFSNALLDSKVGYLDQENAIEVKNAFNIEYTHMRRSLAPRLLENLRENSKYEKSLSFFEIGRISSKTPTLVEHTMLAGVTNEKGLDAMRSDIESFLHDAVSGVYIDREQGGVLPFLHPNGSGVYTMNGESIGSFGRIHPETAQHFDLPNDISYFEIDLEAVMTLSLQTEFTFREIQKYPSIPRELNFILPERTPTGEIARDIDVVHPWIHEVTVSSIFIDDTKIGPGKKSVTFHFFLSNPEATITDDEAMNVQNMIIDSMNEKGYELRGM